MTPDVDEFGQPLRSFPAQWMVALLAGLGTLALQVGWLSLAESEHIQSWRATAALVVVASAYLIATVCFHAATARWRPNTLVPRMWRLGRGLIYDIAIGLFMVVAIARGPHSGILKLGLWIVPPTLLTVCVVSAAVTLLALWDGYQWLFLDIPPSEARLGKPRTDWARAIGALLLILLLFAIEPSEPLPPGKVQGIPAATASI